VSSVSVKHLNEGGVTSPLVRPRFFAIDKVGNPSEKDLRIQSLARKMIIW
jgi:hypothetical protein